MTVTFQKQILLCSILLALPACSLARAEKTEPLPGAERQVVYKTVGDVELVMHIFEPEGKGKKMKRPAIVFFFGGGWVGGSPSQFFEHSKYFASRGMVAISAEYRTQKKHKTSPFECVKDGKSAIRWVRANAKKLGIDPKRVAAGGGSAGGHVAACTGVIEGHDEKGEDLAVSSVPNAMVLFNPVIDTTEKGYGANKLEGRTTEISPAHHVVKGIPPTIIFHGTADTTVPFENAERFTALMKKAGNTCKLVPFEGKKHGFFNHGRDKGQPDPNQSFKDTVRAADEFLRKQGFLKGEPTL